MTKTAGRAVAIAVAITIALVGAACGDDDGDVGAGSTTTATGGTDSTTSTTAGGGDETTTTTGGDPLEGASTDPVSGGDEHLAPAALLQRVDLGRHEGFDRVVFEFAGTGLPGYEVKYVEGPITEDGSGNVVDVDGDFYLSVRFFPASGYDVNTGQATYTGPTSIPGSSAGTGEVQEVVRTGDFEAVLNWVIGLADKVDFLVTELSNPTRLVIDVRNH